MFRDLVIVKDRLTECLCHHHPCMPQLFHVLSEGFYRLLCDGSNTGVLVVVCLIYGIQ